jgi:anti-anti-sigma regulatory factor
MLRITEIPGAGDGDVILKLEGRIVADWGEELERVCRQWLSRGRAVVIDMADVTFVDRKGARMLRSLAAAELAIAECPSLIRDLLGDNPEESWR